MSSCLDAVKEDLEEVEDALKSVKDPARRERLQDRRWNLRAELRRLQEVPEPASKRQRALVLVSCSKLVRDAEPYTIRVSGLDDDRFQYIFRQFPGFSAWWEKTSSSVPNHACKLAQCKGELGPMPRPYTDGKNLLEAILQKGTPLSSRRCPGKFFINEAAHDGTRIDVAWCRKDVVTKDVLYVFLELALEYKVFAAGAFQWDQGYGQILDRSYRSWEARNERQESRERDLLAGAVLDNSVMQTIITERHSDANNDRYFRFDTKLLCDANMVDTNGRMTVNRASDAFREIGFLCYMASVRLLEGQGFASLPHLKDGRCIIIRANGVILALKEPLQAPTVYGGVWAADLQQPGSSERVVLKLGPAPEASECARQLHLPLWPWEQVSREVWALKLLGTGCSNLPSLAAEGRIEAWDEPDPCTLAGCTYVATLMMGQALLSPSLDSLPVLDAIELQALVAHLLLAILYLLNTLWDAQDHALAHNDICPSNIGIRIDDEAQQRVYYLFDLGAASRLGSAQQSAGHDDGSNMASSAATSAPAGHACFMPVERLLGGPPNQLSDMVSLVYTAIVLAGCTLPWEDGTAKGDFAAAVSGRLQLRGHSPELQCLPTSVGTFASAVLDASARGCSELPMAQWHLRQLQTSAQTEKAMQPNLGQQRLGVGGWQSWTLPAVPLQSS